MPTRPSPRHSVTILLTLLAGAFAALADIFDNLATSAIPPATIPYVRFSCPALGVVWISSRFAPYDLNVGDKLRTQIYESIQGQDKVLFVLFEHALKREWVERECQLPKHQCSFRSV